MLPMIKSEQISCPVKWSPPGSTGRGGDSSVLDANLPPPHLPAPPAPHNSLSIWSVGRDPKLRPLTPVVSGR